MTTAKDKVVVITGASAGLGRAIARMFGKDRARVALLARGQAGLDAAKREITESGGQAVALPTDVADPAQVEQAAQAAEEQLGPIDIWINNAMASVFSPVHQMTPEDYQRVTAVTYLGQVYGVLSALKRMRPRNRGTILLVGSALAYRGIPLQSAYCAAKHAVQGFADSLRTELLHDKSAVTICMVQMPAINTPQFRWVKSRLPRKAQPVPPIYQPEVAAAAVHYAALHPRREIYVGWPTIKAIIGNKMFPGYADRYLAEYGYEAQQTAEPEDPNRPDNLWHPLEGDYGAHGVFDRRSSDFSPQVWMDTHRTLIAAVGALALAGAAAALRPRRSV